MATEIVKECPICGNVNAKRFNAWVDGVNKITCEKCGEYVLSREALTDELEITDEKHWSEYRRVALSHLIRTGRDLPKHHNTSFPKLTAPLLLQLREIGLEIPLPSTQLRNLVRYLGNYYRSNGKPLQFPTSALVAIVGTFSRGTLIELIESAEEKGLVTFRRQSQKTGNVSHSNTPAQISLTLDGWERWERIRQGGEASRDGFIAMQFGNDRLDGFVEQHVQGTVAEKLGLKIHRVDSEEKVRADLIDNVMREAIEDAAFVLCELSHGNKGAYWEAGLAEGLGKPVIYLCEQAIWDDPKTRPHFDVNHRTTVMWDENKIDKFVAQLIATIKNSLRHRTN
tara:strand:+ start:108 stop:1127 length:1020 start_codon:yes stop_codon:yes gene_type:complete